MAEAASLIEKYKGGDLEGGDPTTSAEFHAKILNTKPAWEKYPSTQNLAHTLKMLETDMSVAHTKAIMMGDKSILRACVTALSLTEKEPLQWMLTVMYDMLREDSSCFAVFEELLKEPNNNFYNTTARILESGSADEYVADKAAWLLSAVIGNVPGAFAENEVEKMVTTMQRSSTTNSNLGILEAIVNLLKADRFRKLVWQSKGVEERVNSVSPQSSPPPVLYKSIFALWMLSFEPEGSVLFNEEETVKKIRDCLTFSRVEKVVRLSLTVLRNFISHKKFAEEVVELGVLEVVQQLEFEKWRDAELYDDIRDMTMQVSAKVQEMSNFDRYERELSEGRLKWGFIHSSKFWAENVLKFEQNDFRALKMLAGLLSSEDATTLAVACHDLGEFVTMHPLGKKQIAGLKVKESVMSLMSNTLPTHKEVRREALLCCQKIMLNKWQDVETA